MYHGVCSGSWVEVSYLISSLLGTGGDDLLDEALLDELLDESLMDELLSVSVPLPPESAISSPSSFTSEVEGAGL